MIARVARSFALFAVAAGLAACSTPGPGQAPDGIWDPNETANRRAHDFNKKLDTALLRPVARTYVAVLPEGVQYNVSTLADTLGTPKSVVNQLLQGDLAGAGRNTLRFAINATLGFGGIADVAGEMGLPQDKRDFGETLYVWGVPEGAFVYGRIGGPSTERDRAGSYVDLVLDPLAYVIPAPERYYGTAVRVADKVGQRGQFTDTVDSILYDSADSYAQSRLIYLQNRRFELGETPPEPEIDPFALNTEGF